MLKNKKAGFTLMELLVVVMIIAILALLGWFFTSKAKDRARDAQRKSDLRQIKTALELYRNVYNQYPTHNSSNQIVACGEPAVACSWGEAWTRGTMTYMKKLGKDPLPTKSYSYQRPSSEEYCLIAELEMDDDELIAESQAQCSSCGATGAEYVVCND